MKENHQIIDVSYGKIHIFTLGKEAWNETYPRDTYPNDAETWRFKSKKIISEYTGISIDRVFALNQIHTRKIAIVEGGVIKDWIPEFIEFSPLAENLFNDDPLSGDGLFTIEPGTVLVTRTADCLPVFCYSKSRPMVSVLHAGWRGAHYSITEKLIYSLLENHFEENDLKVVFGPSISKENYIIQWDVAKYFSGSSEDVLTEVYEQGYLLGIKEAVIANLRRKFPNLDIDSSNEDVFSSSRYYSHRCKELGRNFNVIFWES